MQLRRSQSFEAHFDPEIEAACRRNNRERRERLANAARMADPPLRPPAPLMRDWSKPSPAGAVSCIRRPAIDANTFEFKPSTIQMMQNTCQFGGGVNEDPNAHISSFLEICDTFRTNGVGDEAVRLRLFPFTLRDKAKAWLVSLPADSVRSWADLAQKFLSKYFPPAKTAKLRMEIASFTQWDSESLYEAWERYKEMMRKCPHHGLQKWLIVETFYNGVNHAIRSSIDTAAGGSLMSKNEEEAYNLIDEMSTNSQEWPAERTSQRRGLHEIDAITKLSAQMESLVKKVDSQSENLQRFNKQFQALKISIMCCGTCGGNHLDTDCQMIEFMAQSGSEQVLYTQNAQGQFRPFQPSYMPNQNNYWKQQTPPQNYQPPVAPPVAPATSSLEEMMKGFINTVNVKFQNQDTSIQRQDASIKNIETQIGQLANILHERLPGQLPSNTVVNPKDQAMAVTLRSGKQTQSAQKPTTDQSKNEEENPEEIMDMEKQQFSQPDASVAKRPELQPYVPKIPFPERLHKNKLDKQFSKFLDIFRKLHINIPFAEALEQMPSYAKFMKDILSRKRKLEEHEMVMMTEESTAIIQNKLPLKMKDPGKFTIPCTIGSTTFHNALCDLGASINLMPYSIFKKLDMGELKPTTVSLQLADRSLKYPNGVVEDVLIKVDKFIFPVDFVVLDMAEDSSVPILLGRPFLATGRTLIDVEKGRLILRVQDEEVVFNIHEAMKYPMSTDSCYEISTLDEECTNTMEGSARKDPLKAFLINTAPCEGGEEAREELNAMFKANQPYNPWKFEELSPREKPALPSLIKPPTLEFKTLPSHLRYAFVQDTYLPVIISSSLTGTEEDKLLRVLHAHERAIGWDPGKHHQGNLAETRAVSCSLGSPIV